MKPSHYIAGILAAAILGTVAGRILFSPGELPPSPASNAPVLTGRELANPAPAPSAPAVEPTAESVLAVVARDYEPGTSPARLDLALSMMTRALSEAEVIALAHRLGESARFGHDRTFVARIFRRYASIDPRAAFELSLTMPTREMASAALKAVVDVWSKANPGEALDFALAQNLNFMQTSAISIGFEALTRVNPRAALARLETLKGHYFHKLARMAVYRAWKESDSEGAARWIHEQSHDDPQLTVDLIREIARSNPGEAVETVLALEPNSSHRRLLGEVMIHRVCFPGGEKVRDRFLNLPGEWLQPDLTREMGINGVARLALEEVIAYGQKLPEGKPRDGYFSGVVSRRASDGMFDDAKVLLHEIGSVTQRLNATSGLASLWTKTNSRETSEWLASLDPGPLRDRAVSSFASHLAAADVESATKWAESIRNPKLRERTLERLGK